MLILTAETNVIKFLAGADKNDWSHDDVLPNLRVI
jgi:hypothetical protein